MGYAPALFVEPPDAEYECGICSDIMKLPTSECVNGHEFCQECVDKVKETSNDCPTCRCRMDSTRIARNTQNAIMKLQVCCRRAPADENETPNTSLVECDWQGSLSDYLQKHKDKNCMFRSIVCPLPGCNKTILVGDLETHLVSSECNRVSNGDRVSDRPSSTVAFCSLCNGEMSFEEQRFVDYAQGNRGTGGTTQQPAGQRDRLMPTSSNLVFEALPQFVSGERSFEEQRFVDYAQGNRGTGGTTQQPAFSGWPASSSTFGCSLALLPRVGPAPSPSSVGLSGTPTSSLGLFSAPALAPQASSGPFSMPAQSRAPVNLFGSTIPAYTPGISSVPFSGAPTSYLTRSCFSTAVECSSVRYRNPDMLDIELNYSLRYDSVLVDEEVNIRSVESKIQGTLHSGEPLASDNTMCFDVYGNPTATLRRGGTYTHRVMHTKIHLGASNGGSVIVAHRTFKCVNTATENEFDVEVQPLWYNLPAFSV